MCHFGTIAEAMVDDIEPIKARFAGKRRQVQNSLTHHILAMWQCKCNGYNHILVHQFLMYSRKEKLKKKEREKEEEEQL